MLNGEDFTAVGQDYSADKAVDFVVLYDTNVARCNMRVTIENSLPRADCHTSHVGSSREC